MATYRLLHVTKDGSDTDGLAEYTNSDTVLLPLHSSDPSGTTEGEMIYNSTDNTIKIYDGSSWISLADTDTTLTLIDEDDMSSNSATSVPSQQSVKAYVDSGATTMTNKILQDYAETDVVLSSSSGVVAIDLANGNTGTLTLTENVTDIDFTNVPTNGVSSFTLKLIQDASSSYTVAINAITVNGGGNVTAKTTGAGGFTMSSGNSAEDICTILFFDAGTPYLNALQDFS